MAISLVNDLVGLIPAAGKGTRIAPIPGSKELFPVGFSDLDVDGIPRRYPKVVSSYLLDRMRVAGAEEIYMVLSDGKWDIMRYFGTGKPFGVHLAYLMVDRLVGMPYSLTMAYPWIRNKTVLFGMSDTIFFPETTYIQLLRQHELLGADITLGLFPVNDPSRFGMVDYQPDLKVTIIQDKPMQTNLNFAWGNAVWGPAFTEFLNASVYMSSEEHYNENEIVLSSYFNLAINSGLKVRAAVVENGEYIDIGSPQDLEMAVQRFSSPPQ